MKHYLKSGTHDRSCVLVAGLSISVAFLLGSCFASGNTPNTPSPSYSITDLVSSFSGARQEDANLLNAWGIAVASDGSLWIASNHDSSALNYTSGGQHGAAGIAIPSTDHATGGSPSGTIVNSTGDFKGAKLIFATEEGILAEWSSGTNATRVTTQKDSEEFKGLAIASDGGQNFIYVTDFKEDKVLVFDKNFALAAGKTLADASIPAGEAVGHEGYGPFGIATINNQLYVTYARHKPFPDNGDDTSLAGTGYIDVYNPNGTRVKQFASGGTLNSPWGIARSPAGFGQFANSVLVGNFGDGTINAYDTTGSYLGQIKDGSGNVIAIDGLWGLTFNSVTADNFLYFTAGPFLEKHGTFGYVQFK